MAHPLFGPEVRQMLEENNQAEMRVFLESLHPATVAETLTGDLDAEQVWRFLSNTDIRTPAAVALPERSSAGMIRSHSTRRVRHW